MTPKATQVHMLATFILGHSLLRASGRETSIYSIQDVLFLYCSLPLIDQEEEKKQKEKNGRMEKVAHLSLLEYLNHLLGLEKNMIDQYKCNVIQQHNKNIIFDVLINE